MYILRINFKSIKKINELKKKLLKIKTNYNFKIKNVFKVKNKNKIFTLLKSPHVNKKAREHFIYKNYVQKIDLNFLSIFQLLNFLILLKKIFSKNFSINIKIIKNNKKICL